MPTNEALHVTPEGGSWAVRNEGAERPSSIHKTRELAVAAAYEMASAFHRAEVLVHGDDGRVRSSLTIRQVGDDLDETEDSQIRAEAMRITPSFARIKAGLGKHPLPEGDFDNEEMPY